MKKDKEKLKEAMRLYCVTDRSWLDGNSLCEPVEEVLKGGITFLQLREKELPEQVFIEEAFKIKALAEKYGVYFVINDSVLVAKAIDADGVHIGQSDGEVKKARSIIGEEKIIGVSVRTVEEALKAEKEGADYLGVGAIFPTSTKKDAEAVTKQTLYEICHAVSIPVVAIGGINEQNILDLKGTKIDGVAVVSALFAKQNKMLATQTLLGLLEEVVGEGLK